MKPGEVSAPIKGDKGVYVVKLTAVNKGGREFNPEAEQATLKSSASSFITNCILNRYTGDSQFFNELFENGNVEDNRYF